MLSPSVEAKVKKINLREKSVKFVDELIAVEAPVNIYVNDQRAVTLFSLPTQLKELGIGWLLSQAIVKLIDEIISVQVKENNVKISCSSKIETRIKAAKTMRIVDSPCGSTKEDFLFLIDRMTKPFVNSDYGVKAEKILQFVKILNEKSALFKLTGGTHSAAIFHEGKLVAFAEDIGRHNAVDKVIGAAAEKKVEFSKCVIVSSGRQPANMVLKAARVGIPIVASIAGPVYSGVDVAIKTGVTLICFARGQRMNVYSYPERVEVT
ncbi:MAG: formate dehydrogenase accessory sulfurtransferase FdhD [Candidatus Bathyarchaeota archaeon]|nr:formate dehydrogenase accessory sulfurtransferase FdhD [Candidatus Bathyarchaeota archaeon]MDH5690352.1 formate dehydrogenase accessory sulfurtransferase FdhD [Candidatus Bathyarchaeota archaeon]